MKVEQFAVSGSVDHVYVSNEVICQSVKLDANGFFKALLTLPSLRCLDLLRVAAGIYSIDRICKRKKSANNEHGIRAFHVTFEVRDLPFWSSRAIRELLQEVLEFLTGDDWDVDFVQSKESLGTSGHQDFLDLPKDFEPRQGALYSGGLDSAAGLASRFLDGANDFMLVTVGHQTGLHQRITTQLRDLGTLFVNSERGALRFQHSTLTISLSGGSAKRMRLQERTQRSRAFLFCSAMAIAAKAYRLRAIEMFENGVGAINLPLMTGMLGTGLATRGAHPTFLRLMSNLASKVAECEIEYILPFHAKTKGEMLAQMKSIDGAAVWAQASRSCVHTSLRETGKTHCGRCPACIERRQAFFSAGILEDMDVYQTDVLNKVWQNENEDDYFRLYRVDASKWIAGDESVKRRMSNHLCLTNVPIEAYQEAIALQVRQSREALLTYGMSAITQQIFNAPEIVQSASLGKG
jgi:Queuosine biosynthesis protein QueC